MEKTDKIAHVPKIVYHWRTVEGSTSNRITAKPYVLKGQLRAIEKHLQHVGWKAKPYHDWTGQLYIDWQGEPRPAVFAIHLIYKKITDISPRDLNRLIKNIKKQPDFASSSRIILFNLKNTDKGAAKNLRKLRQVPNVEVQEYESGGFVRKFVTTISPIDVNGVFYITDSISKISKDSGDTPWISQLSGWLSVPEIGLAGGLSHAPDGRVVDCGSFFNKAERRFYKFYFGTGHRSGYIGHLQWQRNFLLPSERFFAFKKDLLRDILKNRSLDLTGFRDDELPKLLAIQNYAKSGRAVYDPSVTSVDRAPFHIILPHSKQLGKFMEADAKDLLRDGDPYYNPNLAFSAGDPKPALPEKRSDTGTQSVSFELDSAGFVLLN
jgi:hypothetical protein